MSAAFNEDAMQKKVHDHHDGQFLYLNRWVDKKSFRAFVYNEKGEQKLANSYAEFETLTNSGVWFASKPDVSKKWRPKNAIRTDG
jgi:hypothetical protein